MTSVTAAARSSATSDDLPTPASPESTTMRPGSRKAAATTARCTVRPTYGRAVPAPITRSWSPAATRPSR